MLHRWGEVSCGSKGGLGREKAFCSLYMVLMCGFNNPHLGPFSELDILMLATGENTQKRGL